MAKKILIFLLLKLFIFSNESIKSDSYYVESFSDFYFNNLSDFINKNYFNFIKENYKINKNDFESMGKFSLFIYNNNYKLKSLNYEYDYYIFNKKCIIESYVQYSILDGANEKTINSYIIFNFSLLNGKDFQINNYEEYIINNRKINLKVVEKGFKLKSSTTQVLNILEKGGIKELIYYHPPEIEYNKYIQYLNDYAFFLSETDRYKEAIPILEKVINLSPERVVAYLNLGDCYYKEYQKSNKKSDKEKVIENYKKYVSLLKKGAKIPERVSLFLK